MNGRRLRYLITGGAGFIGSHLAEQLADSGCGVTVLDKRIPEAEPDPRVDWLEGDILDESLVGRLVERHDGVFHLAALLGVRRTMAEPAAMVENNLLGTLHVLRAARREGKKVVFASTSEAYGKAEPPFREDMDLLFGPTQKLRWSYAIGKTLEEVLCLGYARKGLPVTVIRYFNVYGPRQKTGAYGGVVAKFILAALRGDDITVYGDGSQTRCFTYVRDAAEGTISAMKREADGQVVNIGSRTEISIRELAEAVKRLTGSSSPIVTVPYGEVFPPGFEEVPRRVPDMAKAESLLGFRPRIPLEAGLGETIAWFRERPRRGSGRL
ncbi:NAD-dependent epimerase/dehydratase family protein [Cohnella caldifontis]|uniref:NAD-dependent epimerase/dehydratase family protein n=1 Tax=Cohnella caldifontis TaxID=3027471 RepID=UPI0023EBE450|nr:NAD-dependent epimerase/dehydratase family protein [Cohnella sp. YIM B05605]